MGQTVNAILKTKPGVVVAGLQPEMCRVLDTVPAVFARKGYDCWLTSAVREGDEGKHGKGKALDFDSSSNIPESIGNEIAVSVKAYLGDEFGVKWHGPHWHLHVQHPRPEV